MKYDDDHNEVGIDPCGWLVITILKLSDSAASDSRKAAPEAFVSGLIYASVRST